MVQQDVRLELKTLNSRFVFGICGRGAASEEGGSRTQLGFSWNEWENLDYNVVIYGLGEVLNWA